MGLMRRIAPLNTSVAAGEGCGCDEREARRGGMAFGAHEPTIGFDARKSHRERIAAEEAHRRMPPREGGIPKAHPLTSPMRSEHRSGSGIGSRLVRCRI